MGETLRKLKPRRCAWCGKEFIRWNSLQNTCGIDCAISLVKDKNDKRLVKDIKTAKAIERKDIKLRKEKLKSRSQHLKECQTVFNRFIRLRDEKDPCISCQRHHTGQYHAGHYKSVGAHPELRFNELNCSKQCRPCNEFKSGNIVNYRINLIEKIGQKNVDVLEGKHEPLKLSILEIKELKQEYRDKIKDMLK